MPDYKLQKFEEIIKILDKDQPSTQEVAEVFEVVLRVIGELKSSLQQEIIQTERDFTAKQINLQSELFAALNRTETKLKAEMDRKPKAEEVKEMIALEVAFLKTLIPKETDLSEVFTKIEEVSKKIPEVKETTAIEMRDKLETLKEDERLDKSAIRGMEEIEKKINENTSSRPTIFGKSGIRLFTSGTKRGLIQELNLIAGSGVTLTYNRANGRNDLTITASGTGGGVLEATGDINDTNLTFTFASEPAQLVINGLACRPTGGSITWSYNAGTVTLSQPVGSGGDIYGIN